MIKILLIEDQKLVRDGIKTLLELKPGFEVTACASDGQEGLEMAGHYAVDIILLDIRMPVMNGVEVLQGLKERSWFTPVIILTTFDDHELISQCTRLGAKGYLRKDVGLDELTSAIKHVLKGGDWVQPAVTDRISRYAQAIPQESLSDKIELSTSETQVLRLVAAGYSNNEIASTVFKAQGTVRNQISSILEKLDVRDRTQAVMRAIELGLI